MGVGRAADPEILSRRFEGDMPTFAAACFSGERSLKVASRRLYTVGTTVKKVIFSMVFGSGRKGAAKRSHTAVLLKGNKNSMVDPESRGAMMALIVPWMW